MPGPTPVAVSDVAAHRHLHEERFARGHPALAGARVTPFEVHLEGWRLASVASDAPEADTSAATAFWPLRLEAAATRFAIDLVLRGGKPIVRQGESGLSREGPNNASYYYSIPRIDAEGRLRVDGETHHVAGGAWLDREWSTSALAPEYTEAALRSLKSKLPTTWSGTIAGRTIPHDRWASSELSERPMWLPLNLRRCLTVAATAPFRIPKTRFAFTVRCATSSRRMRPTSGFGRTYATVNALPTYGSGGCTTGRQRTTTQYGRSQITSSPMGTAH